MDRPPYFEFISYKFEPRKKRVVFSYAVNFGKAGQVFYRETIILPKNPNFKKVPKELFNKILQGLHLALGISYYKLHCATDFLMKYRLSENEAKFWNAYYKKGLGEFLYRNKLDSKIVADFPFDENKKQKSFRLENGGKFLVGVGGGKDSVVSVELLKNFGADITGFFVETQKESQLVNNLVSQMQIGELKIKRILDEKLFDTAADVYKGHIPVSGIYAFLGILSCAVYGYSSFVVSNEFSSNFGNTIYKGATINHQWSKSSEFENLFQEYVKNNISPNLSYFSLLRSFFEIRIAELFAKYKQYFPYFSSCNLNFKIAEVNSEGKWCGKCAKCIFTFLLLSPFLEKDELVKIFGKNLFESGEILVTLRDILGFGRIKPFDCVGTFDEARAAFYLSRQKFRDDLAGEIFLPKIDPEDNRYFYNEHKIPFKIYFSGKKHPQDLISKVFKSQESSAPDYLKFLGIKNVLLLGYGKEGRATEKYLTKNFSGLEIGIADQNSDENYLERQKDFDLAVRSPGVQKELVTIPYTTATNVFFSIVRQIPGVKIIGVTGTKGKSTTASLVYQMLKSGRKNAKFLGNIGRPMLEELLDGKVKKNTIFVLELSSYQLDDIKYSPDVAVVTSLFAEHMDYHRNIQNYFGAKKNILKFQTADNFFVFDQKNKKMAAWAKKSVAKALPFAKEILIKDEDIKLPGQHNRDNIRAATATARLFGISENNIAKAIKNFKGLPHRIEFVTEKRGIKFYDDAISTTPESTIMAIKSLPKIGTIFLGGQDRGYKFSKLEQAIKKYDIKNIVLFPETGERMFKKSRKNLNILETKSMEEAVTFAFENTKKGEICLLSCASPSYSLWKNFEEKGDQFQKFVKEHETPL